MATLRLLAVAFVVQTFAWATLADVGNGVVRGIRPELWQGISIYRDLRYGPRDDAPGEGKGYQSPITGKTADGRVYHTHRSGQFCDLLVAERGPAPDAPVYVNLHGGAWCQPSDKDGESMTYLKRYVDKGFVVINADYMLQADALDGSRPLACRTNATFVAMLRDIDTLASWLKSELLPQIGVAATKFAIGGGSAGGHLATLYGYDQANPSHLRAGLRHDLRVGFVVDVVGPTDLASDDFSKPFLEKKYPPFSLFNDWSVERLQILLGWLTEDDLRARIKKGDLDGARAILARYSPNRMVVKGTPPTILAYCRTFPWSDSDGCVPTSSCFDLMAKLKAADVPHRGDVRSWRLHGWLRDGFEQWVVDQAADFAAECLRENTVDRKAESKGGDEK